jgi:hypothetical protein
MNRVWLAAAAVALLPLAAQAQVKPPKGWEARGERLAHAASGFSCAQKIAGFELTGAGLDDGVPACGYKLPCELKGRACDDRTAVLSIAAIDNTDKRLADFRTMMKRRRLDAAAVAPLGADHALAADVSQGRTRRTLALWFKAAAGRQLMLGGLYAPTVAGEVDAFISAALADAG